jgi:Domain of unknown function (DUF4439)
MSQLAEPVVDAYQAALAAEQRAAFGYAALGPRLRAAGQSLARSDQAAHEELRDRSAAALTAAGVSPVPPQSDYPGLYPPTRELPTLAADLEDGCAAAWRYLYLQAASGPAADPALRAVRRAAQQGLTASALRGTRWRVRAGSARPVPPFPGIG